MFVYCNSVLALLPGSAQLSITCSTHVESTREQSYLFLAHVHLLFSVLTMGCSYRTRAVIHVCILHIQYRWWDQLLPAIPSILFPVANFSWFLMFMGAHSTSASYPGRSLIPPGNLPEFKLLTSTALEFAVSIRFQNGLCDSCRISQYNEYTVPVPWYH